MTMLVGNRAGESWVGLALAAIVVLVGAAGCHDGCGRRWWQNSGPECELGTVCVDGQCVFSDRGCPELAESVCVGNAMHFCFGTTVSGEGTECTGGQQCVEVQGQIRRAMCVVDQEPCETSHCDGNVGRSCISGFATWEITCGEGERCALSYGEPRCAAEECPDRLESAGCRDDVVVDCPTNEVTSRFTCPEGTACQQTVGDAWCAPSEGVEPPRFVAVPAGRVVDAELEAGDAAAIVDVAAFEMLETEVTRGQYQACVDAEICSLNGCYEDYELLQGDGRLPVRCVGDGAERYCSWLNARLPMLSEWRHALGNGGELGPYPWGDGLPSDCALAVLYGVDTRAETRCEFDVPQPPCGHAADVTMQGVCDLAGNVAELVRDVRFPLELRVVGASFDVAATEFEQAMRAQGVEQQRGKDVGFRCVR